MSATSDYVGGLDAMREIERQISLTVNNLAERFSLALSSSETRILLEEGVIETRVRAQNGSYWSIKFLKDALRIESIAYWHVHEQGREPLEYLKWTKETKGEQKVKNYLWMRIASRAKVLMICHSALDYLIRGLGSRFPEMEQYLAEITEIQKYAHSFKK